MFQLLDQMFKRPILFLELSIFQVQCERLISRIPSFESLFFVGFLFI